MVLDKRYEESRLKAQTLWSERIADLTVEAVINLKVLSSRLALAGWLGDMVKVLKAVYGLTREDPEVGQALVAAGVDLKTIAPEIDYFVSREGKQASRVVLWDTHHSRFNTSITLQCNVMLF